MPLHARRPNLPAIHLPLSSSRSSDKGMEELRTPVPFATIPFAQTPMPMAMTPDTPSFNLSLDALMGKTSLKDELPWTEDEDGIIQTYIAHPPRPLSTTFPPGTLPPPGAIDELTSQLIALESQAPKRKWRHGWTATRERIFTIARRESMRAVGGHRRLPSESRILTSTNNTASATNNAGSLAPLNVDASSAGTPTLSNGGDFGEAPPTVRPKLSVLGGNVSRQQHSMDSLYGDAEPQTFEEALRLSNTLQSSAQSAGAGGVLHSGSGLSSPLAFTFNFGPPRSSTSSTTPTGASLGVSPVSSISSNGSLNPGSYGFPRPTSLLQRGKSFTSEDWERENKDDHDFLSGAEELVKSDNKAESDSQDESMNMDCGLELEIEMDENGYESVTSSAFSHYHFQADSMSVVSASPRSSSSMTSLSSVASGLEEPEQESERDLVALSDDVDILVDAFRAEPTFVKGVRGPETSFSFPAKAQARAGAEADPYTPLNSTFPASIIGLRNPQANSQPRSRQPTSDSPFSSNSTTPGGSGSATPSITVTVESPELPSGFGNPRRRHNQDQGHGHGRASAPHHARVQPYTFPPNAGRSETQASSDYMTMLQWTVPPPATSTGGGAIPPPAPQSGSMSTSISLDDVTFGAASASGGSGGTADSLSAAETGFANLSLGPGPLRFPSTQAEANGGMKSNSSTSVGDADETDAAFAEIQSRFTKAIARPTRMSRSKSDSSGLSRRGPQYLTMGARERLEALEKAQAKARLLANLQKALRCDECKEEEEGREGLGRPAHPDERESKRHRGAQSQAQAQAQLQGPGLGATHRGNLGLGMGTRTASAPMVTPAKHIETAAISMGFGSGAMRFGRNRGGPAGLTLKVVVPPPPSSSDLGLLGVGGSGGTGLGPLRSPFEMKFGGDAVTAVKGSATDNAMNHTSGEKRKGSKSKTGHKLPGSGTGSRAGTTSTLLDTAKARLRPEGCTCPHLVAKVEDDQASKDLAAIAHAEAMERKAMYLGKVGQMEGIWVSPEGPRRGCVNGESIDERDKRWAEHDAQVE